MSHTSFPFLIMLIFTTLAGLCVFVLLSLYLQCIHFLHFSSMNLVIIALITAESLLHFYSSIGLNKA